MKLPTSKRLARRNAGQMRPGAGTSSRVVRSGFTLVEMLVVVTIMAILLGLAATMIKPATEGRRIREAARSVNVYLASARNRAMETGRPCGVTFRVAGTTTFLAFAMTLDQCEVPPTYCGATETSVADVTANGGTITATLVGESLPSGIRPLDLIQFNYQGAYGTIAGTAGGNSVDADGYITGSTLNVLNTDDAQNSLVPWSSTPVTVPYRIFRSPMKSAAEPMQLPASTVVDFPASGVGTYYWGVGDVTILFGPGGGVDQLSFTDASGTAQRGVPADMIYILIGRRERMLNTSAGSTEATWTNYQDLGNLWIVVQPQTGLITTEPVGSSSGGIPTSISNARGLAGEAQGMGGN